MAPKNHNKTKKKTVLQFYNFFHVLEHFACSGTIPVSAQQFNVFSEGSNVQENLYLLINNFYRGSNNEDHNQLATKDDT